MLTIRLQRVGRKHQPSFRIVVVEKRSKLGGPPAENLGSYNPTSKETIVDRDKVLRWIGLGAKPTPTVHNLLVKKGVIPGPKIAVKIRKKAQEEFPPAESAAAPAEKKKEELATESVPDISQETEPEERKSDAPPEG